MKCELSSNFTKIPNMDSAGNVISLERGLYVEASSLPRPGHRVGTTLWSRVFDMYEIQHVGTTNIRGEGRIEGTQISGGGIRVSAVYFGNEAEPFYRA